MHSDSPHGAGDSPRDPTDEPTRTDDTGPADPGQARSDPSAGARGEPAAALPAEDLSHDLPQRLADAEALAAEQRDRYLRAHAEMENVRRRAQDEVARAHKFAIESFAESLLPVRDSLELALKADAPSVESIREGVEATLRQLASVFEKNRLVEIDPAGEKFDPAFHQAISMVPASPEVAANHVVTVLQKGYLISDRVLRPALVTVARG